MTLATIATFAAAISLLVGSGFVLVGVIGLLKFNDPMTRLHAPTKVGTVGIGMLLAASILVALASGDPSIHELLIMAFLFVTAPVSANFIAKVNIHKRTCDTPPLPPQDDTWSTLSSPDVEPE
ncbi:MAG: pesticidal protein Cry5Ba [Boseongicola sp.]|nr:MAG: pesticidal protein Cry5Ba [Boseongicola sp.]